MVDYRGDGDGHKPLDCVAVQVTAQRLEVKLKVFTCLLLMGASSTALALGQIELGDLKSRFDNDTALSALNYSQAIDIKAVSEDWMSNPARATMKYNKPNAYRGKLKRIYLRNGSDGDLIFDAGNGNKITAILFPYQFGPWVREKNGEWKPEGGLTTMEFSALYDKGQEFFLTCNQAQPRYLLDCLAFPVEVVK
jgi:hypothetical protein